MLLERELKLVTVEGQSGVLYQELQRGVSAKHSMSTTTSLQQCFYPHCCSGLFSADSRCFWSTNWKKQRSTTLEPLYSITPSSCSPPAPPFFVNFMDLSANGFPPHRPPPPHIWHLRPGPSRRFPVAPPLALSGRSEPAAREGGGGAHHLVLFTLLTGVLLSSQMISVDITSVQQIQQQCHFWMTSWWGWNSQLFSLSIRTLCPLNDSFLGQWHDRK